MMVMNETVSKICQPMNVSMLPLKAIGSGWPFELRRLTSQRSSINDRKPCSGIIRSWMLLS